MKDNLDLLIEDVEKHTKKPEAFVVPQLTDEERKEIVKAFRDTSRILPVFNPKRDLVIS